MGRVLFEWGRVYNNVCDDITAIKLSEEIKQEQLSMTLYGFAIAVHGV